MLDFVANPGTYLIATRQETSTTAPFAALATDLWLKRKASDTAEPMRDAHGASGERGQQPGGGKPLLQVAAEVKSGGEFVLILAGLRAGRGVFLQKVKNAARKPAVGIPGVKVVTADGSRPNFCRSAT